VLGAKEMTMTFRVAVLLLALTGGLAVIILAQEPGEATSAAALIQEIIEEAGINKAIHEFLDLRTDSSVDVYFDEDEFSSLGYSLVSAGRIEEALGVFKMNTMLFPESGGVFESLGEGYMLKGDIKRAIENYEKSLALDPSNENAGFILDRINGHIHDALAETREVLKYSPGESMGLEGDYLGQEPPGLKPKVFAPGIVSTRGNFEFSFTISPDGRELYFNRRGSGLMGCRYEEDGWTAPQEPDFLSGRPGAFEPHISPDGERFFFGDGPTIWVATRTGSGWGEPQQVMPGMYATTTHDGTIYVTDINPPPEFGTIVKSRPVGGGYTEPERVGDGVNLPVGSAHPCIAPDESFIIFDSVLPGSGEGHEHTDLFVCFRNSDGSWGDAVNLGPDVNTPGGNICASLSPDGKYLFFQRHRDIYWVSTEVIERLRPK
jgi:hypothetical protein